MVAFVFNGVEGFEDNLQMFDKDLDLDPAFKKYVVFYNRNFIFSSRKT